MTTTYKIAQVVPFHQQEDSEASGKGIFIIFNEIVVHHVG